jgi:hypothetical protein
MSAQHKHTAGPWYAVDTIAERDDHFMIIVPSSDPNADHEIAPARAFGETERETKANAALISASPDLLQCLEDVMQDLFGRLNHGVSMEHMQAAAAAIAKAKGGV